MSSFYAKLANFVSFHENTKCYFMITRIRKTITGNYESSLHLKASNFIHYIPAEFSTEVSICHLIWVVWDFWGQEF